MAQSPNSRLRAGRRRRSFNMTRMKSGIVFLVGCLTAFGGALTGLGTQVAFAPMLSWMLGFSAEKASATALRFAGFAAGAAVFGAYAAYQMAPQTTSVATASSGVAPELFWPSGLISGGLLLFVGATVGAILTKGLSPGPEQTTRRRFFNTLGIGLALLVIAEARLTFMAGAPHQALWHSSPSLHIPGLLLLGAAAGGLSQIAGLSINALMVPGLFFVAGYSVVQATTLSLFVSALASILPSWSYSRRGIIDRTYTSSATIGGLFGGLVGGLVILHLPGIAVLTLFAVVVMFLSAREISRIALDGAGTSHQDVPSEE